MTIQSIDSTSTQNTLKTDFQALKKAKQDLADAEKSGNQDQVSISQQALEQAQKALGDDMKSSAGSAKHTRHHHKHGHSQQDGQQVDLNAQIANG